MRKFTLINGHLQDEKDLDEHLQGESNKDAASTSENGRKSPTHLAGREARREFGARVTGRLADYGYDRELVEAEVTFVDGNYGLPLLVLIAVVTVIGAAMVLSTTFAPSLASAITHSPFAIFEKQLVWLFISAVVFFVISKVPSIYLAAFFRAPILLANVLLLVVLVPGIGIKVSGARRWIGFSFLTFQPSEFAKLAIVGFLASFFAAPVRGRATTLKGAMPAIIVSGAAMGLILIEPDMGTSIVVGIVMTLILFLVGMKMRYFLPFVTALFAGGLFSVTYSAYRRQRFFSFLHPWQNRLGYSYQEVQGLVAFATGGLHGVGVGAGISKWGYLPNAQTDFIYAIVGQETGVIGAVIVLVLLLGLAGLIFRISQLAEDRFESIFCAGVAVWIAVQTLLNVGAVLGVLPVTGVPLPLISYGGSSMVFFMVALGVVYKVARKTERRVKV
ncbi:MAG: putative peptidoglycan glycosyltransferase FtsW [Actinomycetota bacterium]|nr:putative peptidoglycan glycosyltransferase FtsW [Actinomycetota bacterium]